MNKSLVSFKHVYCRINGFILTLHMCVSQSTLDSIETSQDDEARIDLTRLES